MSTLRSQPLFPWRKIHFIGIGGVGMSGLAQLLLLDDCRVCGSDLEESSYTRRLAQAGALIHSGPHAAAHLAPDTELVVFSSAVTADNPERLAAQAVGIPQIRRGDFLARLAACHPRVIAIGGSHGKTTVTAMLAWILRGCSFPAAYIVGGEPSGLPAADSHPAPAVFVTEADESDGSLAALHPDVGILVNVEDDHSWSHGGRLGLLQAFTAFARQSRLLLYGQGGLCDGVCTEARQARPCDPHDDACQVEVPLLGRHNRFNAFLAVEAAVSLGINRDQALAVMLSFPGVKRRATIHLHSKNLIIVEDYAHHPTELRAYIDSLAEAYPGHHHIAIFQAHRYERVREYGPEFATLLRFFDRVLYTPPFSAWIDHREQPDMQILANLTGPGRASVLVNEDWSAHATQILALAAAHDDRPALISVIGAATVTRIIPHLLAATALPKTPS